MPDRSDGLVAYGWDDEWAGKFDRVRSELGADDAEPGRVVRHDGVAVIVATASGRSQLKMRPTVPPLAAGDWVVVHDSAVIAQLPRRNAVRRRDVDKGTEQVLAADVDLVVAVCGLDRPVRQGRIRRTGLLAADASAEFAVVLTKSDLAADAVAIVDQVRHDNPGATVLACAVEGASPGEDLDDLRALLARRTTVLVGESGAGKSTLTNALLDAEVAATGDVRVGDAKGRHTTTSRELHVLPGGGVLVDSPGIRSVGVFADEEALADAFVDIEALSAGCRFRDCTHRTEPGCAVTAAVVAGELDPARLAAWHELGDDDGSSDTRRGRRDYGDRAGPT